MERVRQPGLHLFGTLANCNRERLMWHKGIYQLLKHIPGKVEMNLIPFEGNPSLVFAQNPNYKDDLGYTGVSVLWESHFCIHTWEIYREVDFDLFSCKLFEYDKVLKVLKGFFKGKLVDGRVVGRGKDSYIDILL